MSDADILQWLVRAMIVIAVVVAILIAFVTVALFELRRLRRVACAASFRVAVHGGDQQSADAFIAAYRQAGGA